MPECNMTKRMWVAFAIVVVLIVITDVTSSLNVSIGVILPEDSKYPWSLKKVMPAIDYALANVKKRQILPGTEMIPVMKDSQCSETIGPLAAIDLHMLQGVHVLLGPVCDYAVAPVARFSPHWNIPVLSAGALVTDFDNKSEYKLLTRVHGAYSNAADFFIDISQKFNWTTLGLIYHDNKGSGKGKSNCYFRMEALFYRLKHIFYSQAWYESFDERRPHMHDFGKILTEASNNARSKYHSCV